MPKVTVLMAAYNEEKYIREAIDSILKQTFQDFELIIIDDASTDATRDMVESCSDPRIHLIKNDKNIGPALSRNRGLERSTGKYIAIMDGDDISLPNRLGKQVRFLDSHPEIAIVGTAYYEMDGKGNIRRLCQFFVEDEQIKRQLCMRQVPMLHSTTMARREAIVDVGLYKEYRFTEDKDLWIRMANKYNFTNLQEPLFKCRMPIIRLMDKIYQEQHAESGEIVYACNAEIIAWIWNRYKDIDLPHLSQMGINYSKRKAFADLYLRYGRGLMSYSQHSQARQFFFRSIRCNPFGFLCYRHWLSTYPLFHFFWDCIKAPCCDLKQKVARFQDSKEDTGTSRRIE